MTDRNAPVRSELLYSRREGMSPPTRIAACLSPRTASRRPPAAPASSHLIRPAATAAAAAAAPPRPPKDGSEKVLRCRERPQLHPCAGSGVAPTGRRQPVGGAHAPDLANAITVPHPCSVCARACVFGRRGSGGGGGRGGGREERRVLGESTLESGRGKEGDYHSRVDIDRSNTRGG